MINCYISNRRLENLEVPEKRIFSCLVSRYQYIKKISHNIVIKLVTAKTNFEFVDANTITYFTGHGGDQGCSLF